jgi:hypothetical protein
MKIYLCFVSIVEDSCMGKLDAQNNHKLNKKKKKKSGGYGFGLKKPTGRGREGALSRKQADLTRGSMTANDPWAAET